MPTTKKAPARSLAAVILAAGHGKRMKSSLPKPLLPVCGKPALWHVLQLAKAARPTSIVIVVGMGARQVREAVTSWGITPTPVFVEQEEQLGTGHAVLVAEKVVGRAHDVLTANGDLDPVRAEDIKELLRVHRRTRSAATLLTTTVDRPGGYGRVVRDEDRLLRIVEHADATSVERRIHEVGTNWVAFRREDLFNTLPLVGRENRQGEYYLNDVYPILMDKGERVSAIEADTGGVMGFNSRTGHAGVERVLRSRINDVHMDAGVTLTDPSSTYIEAGVRIGAGSVILPQTFLEGATRIGAGCTIGPSTRIVDSVIADGAEVTFSVVKGTKIGAGACVGPFSHLRQGADLAEGTKAGSFVEIKGSKIGAGSKVPHLSYVGDATIGKDVNIGAGTVTVNYDGFGKHRTRVDDGARIGSDSMLVAPVRIGKGAVTGAGSTITKDVPPGALAVERSEQKVVEGYRKRTEARHTTDSKPAKKAKKE